MSMNNTIKYYKNAVVVLKDQPISIKGTVYTTSEHLTDDSIITLITKNSILHFKFSEIINLIVKIPYEDRYNITYKNKVYSVYNSQPIYHEINSVFINAMG